MPRNFAAALITAVFLVGTAAGTLSVVSAATLAQHHAATDTVLELNSIL